jgi:SAM-dependent MidA family methyltransferase
VAGLESGGESDIRVHADFPGIPGSQKAHGVGRIKPFRQALVAIANGCYAERFDFH